MLLFQDFGDYSDSYYSVQTTEGERISQLIAGYIDIILKKVTFPQDSPAGNMLIPSLTNPIYEKKICTKMCVSFTFNISCTRHYKRSYQQYLFRVCIASPHGFPQRIYNFLYSLKCQGVDF